MEAKIGYAFNNPQFSDRTLSIEVEPPETDRAKRSRKKRKPRSSSSAATLHINSLVLASKSPFFYKMFSNGMKESEQQTATLTVHASEESALLDLLQFMYDNMLKANTPAQLFKVLVLADRYQVVSRVTYCAQKLSSLPMTFELALSCQVLPSNISEIDNSHLRSLIDAAKIFLSKNFSLHYDKATKLSLETVESILSLDTLEVDSEDDIYDFVSNWAKARYKSLNRRRQVFSSRLCQLIRFPHMSCEKLKTVLQSEELELGDATKMVVEALLSKIQNHTTHADATSVCQGRVYKLRPVDVIVPDSPHQECIVYSKFKKEECNTVSKESTGICTQKFHVWNESFYLKFEHRPMDESPLRDIGICLMRCTGKSTTDALKLDLEVAVRLKTTGEFTIERTCSCTLEKNRGWWVRISQSWNSLMAPGSQYFDNDILYVRVTVALKQ